MRIARRFNAGKVRIAISPEGTAECAILFLPSRKTMFGKDFVCPFGRATLNELKCLGNGESCRQRQQDMDVVFDAADFKCVFVLVGNAAQKLPESLTQRRRSLVLKTVWK